MGRINEDRGLHDPAQGVTKDFEKHLDWCFYVKLFFYQVTRRLPECMQFDCCFGPKIMDKSAVKKDEPPTFLKIMDHFDELYDTVSY